MGYYNQSRDTILDYESYLFQEIQLLILYDQLIYEYVEGPITNIVKNKRTWGAIKSLIIEIINKMDKFFNNSADISLSRVKTSTT